MPAAPPPTSAPRRHPPGLLLALTVLALPALLAACQEPAQTVAQGARTTPAAQTSQTTRTSPAAPAPPARDPQSGLPTVAASALPREGQATLRLIARGGPFRSSRDGAVFGNREGLLPRAARGTYREYTVPTPGSADRGARRIVCAGLPVTRTDRCYYTADHYASFRRILP